MKIAVKDSTYVDEQGIVLEEGDVYDATLREFREWEGPNGDRLIWVFDVEDPESGETVEVAAFTSFSTFDGDKLQSNLVKYSKALNDGELPVDENGDFDTDLLEGARGRVTTKPYQKGEITKNTITNVLPPKKRRTSV